MRPHLRAADHARPRGRRAYAPQKGRALRAECSHARAVAWWAHRAPGKALRLVPVGVFRLAALWPLASKPRWASLSGLTPRRERRPPARPEACPWARLRPPSPCGSDGLAAPGRTHRALASPCSRPRGAASTARLARAPATCVTRPLALTHSARRSRGPGGSRSPRAGARARRACARPRPPSRARPARRSVASAARGVRA